MTPGNPAGRTLTAAIYARQSRTIGDTVSIPAQVERCREEAARRGYTVALVSDQDMDTSATKKRLKRPGLDLVRQSYGDIDAVFFFRLDRLARSVKDFATLAEEAQNNRVALISATEPIDMSTPEGAALAGMLSIFAELETKNTSIRLREINEYLVKSGKVRGGRLPWWITQVTEPETGIVTEHLNDNTDTIRDWVDRVLAGTPVYVLVKEMNQTGATSPDGAKWTQSAITKMLRNPTIAGYGVHQGRILRSADGMPMLTRPAAISEEKFRLLQAELDKRKGTTGKTTERRGNLLSSMIHCVHCGEILRSSGKTYACHTKYQGGDCPGNSINGADLHEFVKSEFLRRYGDWREVVDPPRISKDDTEELEQARAAMAELMADRYEYGLFNGPEGRRQFSEMHQRLEQRIAALQVVIEPQEDIVPGRALRSFLGDDIDVWRRHLRDFVSITVKKGTRGRSDVEARVALDWTPDHCDELDELLGKVEAIPPEGDPWREEARARMQARWESRPVKTGTLLEQYEAFQRPTGDTGDGD